MKPKIQKQLQKTAKKLLTEKRDCRQWLKTADGKKMYEKIKSEQKKGRKKIIRELANKKRQRERKQNRREQQQFIRRSSYRPFNWGW